MIRAFDWRDLALLHRIRNRGLCMDSQLAYTSRSYAVQSALRDALALHRDASTFVLRPGEGNDAGVLGQFQLHPDKGYARLTFFSPQDSISNKSGIELMEALAKAAGQRGAQSLIAEVDEKHGALDGLRKAGFAIFARQRIWHLETLSRIMAPSEHDHWRLETVEDEPAITHLHMNLIPGLVQQVEPADHRNGRGIVYWSNDELLGYLHLSPGGRGNWIRPYFHPAAILTDELLISGLSMIQARDEKPLFVCVRSYQGGIGGALDKLGFARCGDEAVMVKRLAKPVTQDAQQILPVLNGKSPEPTAPFVPINGGKQIVHSERES